MPTTYRWKRSSPSSANDFDLVLVNPLELDAERINGLLDGVLAESHRGLTLSSRASKEFQRWIREPNTPLRSAAYVLLSNWFMTQSGDKRSRVASRCEVLWDELFPCRPSERLSSPEPGLNHLIVPAEFESFWRRLLQAQGEHVSDPGAATEVTLHPRTSDRPQANVASTSDRTRAMSDNHETCSRALTETYQDVVPSVVAFISRLVRTPLGGAPIAPPIFGTGFLVHQDGIVVTNRHVADLFAKLPTHPKTGAPGYGAILFQPGVSDEHGPYIRWMIAEIFGYTTLGDFTSDAPWFGEETPDIAFVQLSLRDTPFLKLASEEFYVRPGTPIATVGFPMGEKSMTVMKKLNQLIPFVRHGIVSSVFPFAVPHPHGFTIDIMQQGGSSGSPVFYEDNPTVVGMMAASMTESVSVGGGVLAFSIKLPTNISVAVPAHIIDKVLQSFRTTYPVDRSSFPTLEEWQKGEEDVAPGVGWDVVGPA